MTKSGRRAESVWERDERRESVLQSDGWCRWCRSPPLPPTHFGDFAGAAEKASVLRSPCFIAGPVEEWNVSTTDGLVLFEEVDFSSLKVAAPGW